MSEINNTQPNHENSDAGPLPSIASLPANWEPAFAQALAHWLVGMKTNEPPPLDK